MSQISADPPASSSASSASSSSSGAPGRRDASGLRVFYLTTEFLWPPHHGGRVRSLAQLKLLAGLPQVRAVTFFGLTEVPIGPAEEAALLAEVPGVEILPPVWHPIHLRQHLKYVPLVLWHRLLGAPYLAGKWDAPRVRAALTRALTGRAVDVIYVDHLGMAQFLPLLRRLCPRARLVLEEHNVESDFFGQFAARQRGPLRALATLEWQAARAFEARALRAVDAVVAISEADAEALSALSMNGAALRCALPGNGAALRCALPVNGAALRGAPPVTPIPVPQVVSFERRTPPPWPAEAAPVLGYVGNLTWHPNQRGLSWFVQDVWPRLRRLVPTVRLRIAGSGLPVGPDGAVVAPPEWQAPGIEVVGFVKDLQPFYDQALGFVAPILGGSGVRIKLLEALRAGLPTATTGSGAAGLPLRDGEEVLIADDPDGLAQRCAALCQDAALRERLRLGGYAFLERRHGLTVAQAAMGRALGLPIGCR